jgi:hypothetical protein
MVTGWLFGLSFLLFGVPGLLGIIWAASLTTEDYTTGLSRVCWDPSQHPELSPVGVLVTNGILLFIITINHPLAMVKGGVIKRLAGGPESAKHPYGAMIMFIIAVVCTIMIIIQSIGINLTSNFNPSDPSTLVGESGSGGKVYMKGCMAVEVIMLISELCGLILSLTFGCFLR